MFSDHIEAPIAGYVPAAEWAPDHPPDSLGHWLHAITDLREGANRLGIKRPWCAVRHDATKHLFAYPALAGIVKDVAEHWIACQESCGCGCYDDGIPCVNTAYRRTLARHLKAMSEPELLELEARLIDEGYLSQGSTLDEDWAAYVPAQIAFMITEGNL